MLACPNIRDISDVIKVLPHLTTSPPVAFRMHSLSSSPSRRALKNAKSMQGLLPGFDGGREIEIFRDAAVYPSPAPTSSVGVTSSSAPASPVKSSSKKPTRLPLQQMLIILLPLSGKPVTVGRSSKSSDFALKASNKLASRVHAKIWYAKGDLVVIECLGYNGLTVYVPGGGDGRPEKYDVVANQQIWIERVDGIALDINGDRALIEYEPSTDSDITEDLSANDAVEQAYDVPSSPAQMIMTHTSSSEKLAADTLESLHNTPAITEGKHDNDEQVNTINSRRPTQIEEGNEALEKQNNNINPIVEDLHKCIESETEPTSMHAENLSSTKKDTGDLDGDTNSEKQNPKFSDQFVTPSITTKSQSHLIKHDQGSTLTKDTGPHESTSHIPEENESQLPVGNQQGNKPELLESSKDDRLDESTTNQFSVHREKHESLPTGIRSKMEESESQTDEKSEANTRRTHKRNRSETLTLLPPSPVKKITMAHSDDEVRNIVVNHVAFSRLTSTPLSDIIDSSRNLQRIPRKEVERILAETPSVGMIPREGKDALGKPLEAEYYYMIENDSDESRRGMVEEAKGHRTLRSCRRSHKQYYYKKPSKR